MKINIRKIQEALNKRGTTTSQRIVSDKTGKIRISSRATGRRPPPRRRPCNCGGKRMFR